MTRLVISGSVYSNAWLQSGVINPVTYLTGHVDSIQRAGFDLSGAHPNLAATGAVDGNLV